MIDMIDNSGELAAITKPETTIASSARFTVETVFSLRYWTPSLLSFRTSRDPNFRFTPGHYARLGLQSARDKVFGDHSRSYLVQLMDILNSLPYSSPMVSSLYLYQISARATQYKSIRLVMAS